MHPNLIYARSLAPRSILFYFIFSPSEDGFSFVVRYLFVADDAMTLEKWKKKIVVEQHKPSHVNRFSIVNGNFHQQICQQRRNMKMI